jgi:hypothetical protein
MDVKRIVALLQVRVCKAKATKIKLIDKDVKYADWIVVGHIVLKILW